MKIYELYLGDMLVLFPMEQIVIVVAIKDDVKVDLFGTPESGMPKIWKDVPIASIDYEIFRLNDDQR